MATAGFRHFLIVVLAGVLALGIVGRPPPVQASWGTATLLETGPGWVQYPKVASDDLGGAIAVWYQFDGTRYNIWANVYSSSSGWGGAQLIETDDTADAQDVQIAMGPGGNATVVFVIAGDLWGVRYEPGTGWGNPELVETDTLSSIWAPNVAMDGLGNAIAVWSHEILSPPFSVYANRYRAGTGWGTAGPLELNSSGDALFPRVAMSPNGNATSVWKHYDGAIYRIWAARFVPSTGWSAPELVDQGNGETDWPDISMDAAGTSIAVWTQHDGLRYNAWSNRASPWSGWGAAELLEVEDLGSVESVRVSASPTGAAVAAWKQWNGSEDNIWGNAYAPASGWGSATLLKTTPSPEAIAPDVSMTVDDAMVVWSQGHWSSGFDGFSARYSALLGWQASAPFESTSESVVFADVSHSSTGNATAVWIQESGVESNVWANRWSESTAAPPIPASPSGVTLNVTGLNLTLSWTPPNPANGLDHYNVYRASTPSLDRCPVGTRLAVVPNGTVSYVDLGAGADASSRFYNVRAANSLDQEDSGCLMAGKIAVDLVQGVQHISTPFAPTDPRPAGVFAPVWGSFVSVGAFNSTGWRFFNSSTGGTLSDIDNTVGLRLVMSAPGRLPLVGQLPASTSISVTPGWNFLGYPSFVAGSAPSVFDANGLGGVWERAARFDGTNPYDEWRQWILGDTAFQDLGALTPGAGFWINVSGSGLWSPPG